MLVDDTNTFVDRCDIFGWHFQLTFRKDKYISKGNMNVVHKVAGRAATYQRQQRAPSLPQR